MKRLFLVLSFVCIINSVHAQSSAVAHGKWEENSHSQSHTVAAEPNEFTDVEMAVDKKVVTLAELPDVPHTVWAIVTDAVGEQLEQKRVSAKDNTLDLHRLRKGEMYFLTLMYKDKSRKAFVVHL